MSEFKLKYKPYGERSILIEWPQIISESTLKNVLSCKQQLENFNFKQKVYIKSAYNSILITYDFAINNFYDEVLTLKSLFSNKESRIKSAFKLWKIPVSYDIEFGIDLEEISSKYDIPISDIIQEHYNTKYRVYFLGFLPGFLYLGGLNKKLHFPRKITPRLHVKKGSVAIGGSQTGIYPNESPGGWNIIGNTPLDFFKVNNETACFAQPGDQIQFVSVSKSDYHSIKDKVEDGTYLFESEVLYD